MSTPSFRDRYGMPLSTGSAIAAQSYIEGVDRHLARDIGARACFEAAVTADPGFAMAHAALARLGGMDPGLVDAGGPATALVNLAARATPWERRHVEITVAQISGQRLRAMLLVREQLAEFPRDVLALQQALALIEYGGRRDWPEQRLALLDGLAPHYGDDWYFLGAHSRAHEEAGHLAEAQVLAERALAGNPRSANAAHAVTHVHYELDDHTTGRQFLDRWMSGYDRAAPYYCHLSWHRALFELRSGRHDQALHIYERDIQPANGDGRGRLLDAASLLWRFQLAGHPVAPDAWERVCTIAERSTIGYSKWTVIAHAALVFSARGDAAAIERLNSGLGDRAARGDPVAGTVVRPLVEGLTAFACGDYDEAARRLEPIAGDIVRIGGSRVQRDVFQETLIEACLRSGRSEHAEKHIRRHLNRHPAMQSTIQE